MINKTAPMGHFDFGPPSLKLRHPKHRKCEGWLCCLCNSRAELLEFGQEIIDFKNKFMI